jgi:hypothetical protein
VLRGTDAARTAIESRQLQIRDFLIAMTILAVFLGTMRLAAEGVNGPNDERFLAFVLGSCGVAVGWGTLMLPICLWACFGASTIGVRIVVLIGYLLALATIATGVAAAVTIRGVRVNPNGLGFFLVLNAALLATLLFGLWLARTCGYVLVSVRSARRKPLPAPGSPFAPGEETPA